jgi:outer membrane protein
MGATSGYTGSNVSTFSGRTYALTFGVQLPLFTGFSREYDVRASADELEAATARAAVTRQLVVFQVFSAYYGLQTATQRVRTSADLLASATESESVARGRYREGVGTFVDLLIAQTALANARAQEVQARWEWRTSLAQLAHDVGVLGIHGEPLAPLAPGVSRGTR